MDDFGSEEDFFDDDFEQVWAPEAPTQFQHALAHLKKFTPNWTDDFREVAENAYSAETYNELKKFMASILDRNLYVPAILGLLWNRIFSGNNSGIQSEFIYFLSKKQWALKYVLPPESAINVLAAWSQASLLEILWVSRLPIAAQRKIAIGGEGFAPTRLAGRPELGKKIATILMKKGNANVHEMLAQNPATPSYVLSVLAKTADIGSKVYLARRRDLPTDAWKALAQTGGTDICRILNMNPDCPDEYRVFAGLSVGMPTF